MKLVINKSAKRDFEILKQLEAGVVLTGGEVKSLKASKASLKGSFIKIIKGEAFLINAQINPYSYADNSEYDPKRTRKLLLHKKQISDLKEIVNTKKVTLIPLAFTIQTKKIKLQLAVARGKKEFEKRAALKKKAIKRDLEREIKQKTRFSV